MNKKVTGSDRDAASWYVTFSSNEMVVITAKEKSAWRSENRGPCQTRRQVSPHHSRKGSGHRPHRRVLKRAAALEGNPDIAQKIIDASAGDPSRATSVPETVRAVKDGNAGAGVVYYSAAVAAKNDVDIIRFPASVNMSEAIRNAALVPGTAATRKRPGISSGSC